jgi:ATP-dependent 26S proteasome regulatory subunit
MPQIEEREKVLTMTLAGIPVDERVVFREIADQMEDCSYANIVMTAQRAAKHCVVAGDKKVAKRHFDLAIAEGSKF